MGADHSCSTGVTLQLITAQRSNHMAINCRFQWLPLPLPSAPGVGDQVAETQQSQPWGLGSAFNLKARPCPQHGFLQTPSLYFHEHLPFGPKPKATRVLLCPLCNVANLWLCIMYPGHGYFLTTSVPVWVLFKACNRTYNLTCIFLCFSCCFLCFFGLC